MLRSKPRALQCLELKLEKDMSVGTTYSLFLIIGKYHLILALRNKRLEEST
jgi:hypothetical protein